MMPTTKNNALILKKCSFEIVDFRYYYCRICLDRIYHLNRGIHEKEVKPYKPILAPS